MNCWYTIATERCRTSTPVTFLPSTRTRPVVGLSRPASSRMIDVLPDSVGPSSTLKVPRLSVSETSRMVGMPSTVRVTFSRLTVMSALLLQARVFKRGTMRGNPVIDGGNFGRRQSQSQLGPPPYDVVGGQGPLRRHQVLDFALGQGGAEGLTEIVE